MRRPVTKAALRAENAFLWDRLDREIEESASAWELLAQERLKTLGGTPGIGRPVFAAPGLAAHTARGTR